MISNHLNSGCHLQNHELHWVLTVAQIGSFVYTDDLRAQRSWTDLQSSDWASIGSMRRWRILVLPRRRVPKLSVSVICVTKGYEQKNTKELLAIMGTDYGVSGGVRPPSLITRMSPGPSRSVKVCFWVNLECLRWMRVGYQVMEEQKM